MPKSNKYFKINSIQKRMVLQFPLSKGAECVVKSGAFEVKFESWLCHFLAV